MTQLYPFFDYDRRRFASEMFFTDRTAFFPGRDGWTVEEMKDYIAGAPLTARFALVRDIRLAVRELYANCSDPDGFLPARFTALGGMLTLPLLRSELLGDYIDWLESVREYTDDTRAALDMSMLDVLTRLDADTADFLSGVRKLASLRAVVRMEGDCLVAGFAEREWGRAVLKFPRAHLFSPLALPLPCYFFSVQGAWNGERCSFSILCDTEFSQNDYALRMLKNENWHELRFESGLPELELRLYNYPQNIRLSGASGLDFIERCSAALVGKQTICSDSALSSRERSLLSWARLFDGLARSVELKKHDSLDRYRAQILSALDDRYSCSMLSKKLEALFAGKVSETLDAACEKMMSGDQDGAMRDALTFYRVLRECRARAVAHDCLCSIADDFADCAEHCSDPSSLVIAAECVRDALGCELDRLGFSGEYPHYSRNFRIERQYVSLLLYPQSDRSFHGVFGYELNIACARTYADRVSSLSRGDDMCAPECAALKANLADYAELCSADDAQSAEVSVDLLNGMSARFDPEPVTERLTLASRIMRGAAMPQQYAMRRHRARGFLRNALKAMENCAYLLPFVSVVVLGAYLAARSKYDFLAQLSPAHAVLGALAAALAVFIIACVVSYFKSIRLFWRQR